MTLSSDDKQYRVSRNNRIAMPPGLTGKYYLRRVCSDGAVTFLPVIPPKSAEELYRERQARELAAAREEPASAPIDKETGA